MSTAVLPSLIGLGIDVKREALWNNKIQEAISGKENRIAYWTYPRYRWTLKFNVLRASSAYTELQQLIGFFNSRQGKFDTFLYTDADDNSVTGQQISTGNGSTAAYQLIRTFGSFIEPILAPNVVSAVRLGGVSIPSGGITSPSAPTLGSSSGGSLGGTTYYVKITYVTQSGETQPSSEVNLAVAANNLLTVKESTTAPTGAIGFNVYVSTSTGTETLQNSVGTPVTLGSTWTEPTSGLISGSALPSSNTTGWSVSNWGTSSPGVLTFAGTVLNTVIITADFTYYFPVRMDEDIVAFDMFLSKHYKVSKFVFKSVRN